MWGTAALSFLPMGAKISTLYPKIINLILTLRNKGYTMLVAEFIKVRSRIKMEILYMDLIELILENYQFQDLLATFRQNYPNTTETQKF